jgi:AAA domain
MLENRKVIYLTVGPRGAGKSEYCDRFLRARKDFLLISRDKILMSMSGSVHTSPYEGGSEAAEHSMRQQILMALGREEPVNILLDAWTGYRSERERLIRDFRQWGTDEIVALFFVTTVKYVSQWFWMKPGIAKSGDRSRWNEKGVVYFGEDSPARDFELFHQHAANITEEGFDRVIFVNPLQLELPF